jgi:hypothetical protein
MLVKLPTHDRTLLNSFGRSHATVNEQMPPLLWSGVEATAIYHYYLSGESWFYRHTIAVDC